MKTYKQAHKILPGEFTEIHGELYMAVLKDGLSGCVDQCDAIGFSSAGNCSGYCYRWKDCEHIVFKKVDEPLGDYTVVETPFGTACRNTALAKTKSHDASE